MDADNYNCLSCRFAVFLIDNVFNFVFSTLRPESFFRFLAVC